MNAKLLAASRPETVLGGREWVGLSAALRAFGIERMRVHVHPQRPDDRELGPIFPAPIVVGPHHVPIELTRSQRLGSRVPSFCPGSMLPGRGP